MKSYGILYHMPDIFNYYNYRDYLKDFIARKKEAAAFFSLRYIGYKVGIDAGNLVKILQGERHLSYRYIEPFIAFCKLQGRRALYFEALVKYCRTKSNRLARELFEQLCELKQAPARTVLQQHYEYFKHWQYAAVRSLLDYYDFKGNFEELGAQLCPPISAAEAKRAIDLLFSIGFIKKLPYGRYKPTDKIITTGERWQSLAIEEFQEQMIDLSKQSISRFPRDSRDISTITMNLCQDDFLKIRSVLKESRQKILKIVDEAEASDAVYQLNMQLFPLTKQKQKKRKV